MTQRSWTREESLTSLAGRTAGGVARRPGRGRWDEP